MAVFQSLSLLLLPFILLVLIKLLLMLQQSSRKHRSYHLLPSPPSIPIIGNLHQLGTMPHLSLQQLASKYGPIIFLQLGEIPTIVISSARLAKEVLKTHDLALASRPQLFSAKHLFYNCTDVAFSPYGPYWRNIRKICVLELLSAKRVDTYRSAREEEVARLVSRISESFQSTLDLSKFLGLYANDVLCKIAFGRQFSEGGNSDYHRQGFHKMLYAYQVLLGGFNIGEFFPSFEFMHSLTGVKSRLKDTFRRFDQLFDQILKEHASSEGIEEHKDLVNVLLDVQKKDDSDEMPLTTDNIKAIILVNETYHRILLCISLVFLSFFFLIKGKH